MISSPESLPTDIRTPSGFAAAVQTLSPMNFAVAVSSLTESERKKLSKTAQDLYRDHAKTLNRNSVEGILLRRFGAVDSSRYNLALLAVAPKGAAVRAMRFESFLNYNSRKTEESETEQAAVKILQDRRPDWADDWLTVQLNPGTRMVVSISWKSIRSLIKSGTCRRPATSAYASMFARGANEVDFASEPDLIDDVWLLFQFDVGAFYWRNLASEKWWPCRIVKLLESGAMDRERLLTKILAVLWQDWIPSSLTDLAKFHDHLAFPIEERAKHMTEYVGHLTNPVSTVATWAIRNLKDLSQHATFDAMAVVAALPQVFNHSQKAQPIAALSFLTVLTKRDPSLIPSSEGILSRALTHENADVQEASLKLIEGWHKDLSKLAKHTTGLEPVRPIERVIRDSRERISPVLRDRADSLLKILSATDGSAESSSTETTTSATAPDSISADELRRRIEALPGLLSNPLRLRDSLDAAIAGKMLPSINIDDVPCVLPYVEPISPIASIEELVDVIAAALEHVSSPLEVERILDGISRIGRNYPADFDERSAAVLKQWMTAVRFHSQDSLRSKFASLPSLAKLLFPWLCGERQIPENIVIPGTEARWITGCDLLLNRRTNVILYRLQSGDSTGPLLSLPTHEHGWIDPREFVRRVKSQRNSDVEICRPDLITALLRLAPDYRHEALQEAIELPDEVGRVTRYALGAPAELTEASQEHRAEWLAAGRSRAPHADLPELEELQLPFGPNSIAVGTIQLRLDEVDFPDFKQFSKYDSRAYKNRRCLSLTPKPPDQTPDPLWISLALTVLTTTQEHHRWQAFGWNDLWQASLWPARPELTIARSIQSLVESLDETGSSWFPVAYLLRPLLRVERGWPEISLYAIGFALFSRNMEARAVATDALVEGILDGRAEPEAIGMIFGEFVCCPWSKLKRLAEALASIGRVSLWATLCVATIVEAILVDSGIPDDGYHLLGILLEALTTLRQPPRDELLVKFAAITGKNKTASLAQKLIALRFSPKESLTRQALFEGVRARVERAERCR